MVGLLIVDPSLRRVVLAIITGTLITLDLGTARGTRVPIRFKLSVGGQQTRGIAVPENSSSLPVAGWYPDPAGSGLERWWGGVEWTPTTRPAEPAVAVAPATTFGAGYSAAPTGGFSAQPAGGFSAQPA